MDSQTDTMSNGHAKDPETILRQIAQTRLSLSHKIHSLEGKVLNTVEDASTTVKTSIESVKQTFDIKHQIGANPLYWMGGAFAAGFLVGLTDDLSKKTKVQLRSEVHALRGRIVNGIFDQIFSRLSKMA